MNNNNFVQITNPIYMTTQVSDRCTLLVYQKNYYFRKGKTLDHFTDS